MLILLLNSLLLGITAQSCEVPVIRTKVGDFCGVRQTVTSRPVNAYLGVPFAEPPLAALRLQPPKKIDKSLGYVIADHFSPACYQTLWNSEQGFSEELMKAEDSWNPPDHRVVEDCLKLNIWVPAEPKSAEKLPVMIWIFGGGFISGSPSLDFYNGSVLAALEDIIVVNVNYRVGAFGFLSFGPKSSITGNFGLLDQQAALSWVHENIEAFGGDPERVTLFGESAGSASVTSHLFAPDSHPFYQRVAASSGTMLHGWATNSEVVANSRKLAELLGCRGEESDILRCMQGVEAHELQQAADSIATWRPIQFTFTPVPEDPLYFKGNLFDRLESGAFKTDVDGIFGLVNDEFSYFLPYYLGEERFGFNFDATRGPNAEENSGKINRTQFESSVAYLSEYFGESPDVIDAIRQLYLDEYNIDRSMLASPTRSPLLRDSLARLYSDQFFNCDFTRFVDSIARFINGHLYFYHFTERSTSNPWPLWMGVMHGYEIEYYFGLPVRSPELYAIESREAQKQFSIHVMQMWAEFARNGLPSSNWKPYSPSGERLVLDARLNGDKFEHIADPHQSTCQQLLQYRTAAKKTAKTEL